MAAVAEKIRTGLLELRTPLGSVYVTPSLWQRVYLVWTFRNFRSLPKQVLNRRQRHLIDDLCHAPVLIRKRPLGTSVIGAVENVIIPETKLEAAPAVGNVIEMRVRNRAAQAAAAGATRNRTRWSVAQHGIANVEHLLARGRLIRPAVSRQLARIEVHGAAEWGRRRIRYANRWALFAAMAAVLVGAFIYFHKAPTTATVKASKSETDTAASPQASSGAVQRTTALPPTSTVSQTSLPTVINVAKPSSGIGGAKNHDTTTKVEHAALRHPLSLAPDPPRVLVAEAPENGFRYPITPDANLTGKVDLKAIIGSDGTVKGVDVLSGNRLLAAAAVRAVQHWRYRPPQVDGHPVEAESKIVISFLGDEAVSVRFPPNQ
jgi:TonB family protein